MSRFLWFSVYMLISICKLP